MTGLWLGLALLQAAAGRVQAPMPASSPAAAPAPAPAPPRYPFQIGETLTFSAKLGMITVGTGRLEVARMDTVRGHETFLFRFRLTGKAAFYELDDLLESWVGTGDFASRRFRQDYQEGGKVRLREYEIYPDSSFFRERGKEGTAETPANPLDDTAFFYFVRLIPLEVGKQYVYNRYFKANRNPVLIKVLERERMELPDGRQVDCLVLQPIIKTKGLFSEKSQTRIWLTDDARRLPVKIRSRFPFGTVTLDLQDISQSPAPTSTSSRR